MACCAFCVRLMCSNETIDRPPVSRYWLSFLFFPFALCMVGWLVGWLDERALVAPDSEARAWPYFS